jgi:hypothetical protein
MENMEGAGSNEVLRVVHGVVVVVIDHDGVVNAAQQMVSYLYGDRVVH